MFPVYSVRFAGGALVEASIAYTVPEGKVAVLRTVDFVSLVSGTQLVAIGTIPAGGSEYFWHAANLGEEQTDAWRGNQVFNAGDQIVFDTTGTVVFQASGFLLSA